MPARKAGLYITPPIAALLAAREDQDSLSGRLSTVAERYSAILEAHKPRLSEAEWNACRDALNGVWHGDMMSISLIGAAIADADNHDGLGAKWGVDARALAARVHEMPIAGKVALIEAVETWWAAHQ
ncbi:MAG: hypothetical protein NW217_13350 [Hyphomicrobiaceae bacterium]|nr:hypothetical protein [Hyphomicrobiaceae bacterium]